MSISVSAMAKVCSVMGGVCVRLGGEEYKYAQKAGSTSIAGSRYLKHKSINCEIY